MKPWRIVAVVCLCAAIVIGVCLARWLRPYDLSRERAAARAAGLPLSAAELPLPHYPPNEDAAPDWNALIPRLKQAEASPAWRAVGITSGQPIPPASRNAELRRLLAQERDTLGRIHAATARPGRSIAHGWGPDAIFPELAPMRKAGVLLCLESIDIARQGRATEAIRNQALAFRLARQADEDPTLLGHMVGMAIERATLTGMEAIARENPSPAVAAAIRQAIGAGAPKYDAARAIKGETLFCVTTMRSLGSVAEARAIGSGSAVPSGSRGRHSGFVRAVFQEPGEAVILHYMTRQARIAALPRGKRAPAAEALQREFDSPRHKSPAYLAPSILMASYAKVYERETSVMARRAVTMAGADVLAWRSVHGAFPAALAEAAPGAVDVFTGKPLGYRRTGNGFVVYSAGPKGTFPGLPGKAAKGEVYFSYPAADLTPAASRRPRNAAPAPLP